jgi:DNA-binding response OmpR family regulator
VVPAEELLSAFDAAPRCTVLVVEDEALLRLAIAERLRACGYAVIEAASGDQARALILAGAAPDAVFSDISMPGELDGVAFARWLSASGVRASVLLTSGLPSALDRARESCAHVVSFVEKPYDHDQVVARIRAALEAP